MQLNFRRRHALRPRRGFASIELVMTLPILGIMLMGLLEFSLLFHGRSTVLQASRIGARAATLQGVTQEQVETEVRNVLNDRMQANLTVDVTPGKHSGDIITVVVSVPMNTASPDLLWPIGYSLHDRQIVAETRMIKE